MAECLSKRTQQGLQVVLDPVLISTSGHSLAESDVSKAILQEYAPLSKTSHIIISKCWP